MSEGQPACSVRAEVREMVDREIGHLRQLIERTMAEKDVALDLQRKEYHRRLEELNNAHARADKALQDTIQREAFYTFVGTHDKWREEVQNKLSAADGAALANARFFSAVVVVVGLIFSALAIWLKNK